jgi:hypothetical protein
MSRLNPNAPAFVPQSKPRRIAPQQVPPSYSSRFQEYAETYERCGENPIILIRNNKSKLFDLNVFPSEMEVRYDKDTVTASQGFNLNVPDGMHAVFFYVTFSGAHVIGGFITQKRVVLLHHYGSLVHGAENKKIKAFIESKGKECVIYPPEGKEYDIQKSDDRLEGEGQCARWFFILPYAVAVKLGDNEANWIALGDAWEGSLVKEVYDEFEANPTKAKFKYSRGMRYMGGNTLSEKRRSSKKGWTLRQRTQRKSRSSKVSRMSRKQKRSIHW